jgi:NADH-quinone oxidoreductase subunit J
LIETWIWWLFAAMTFLAACAVAFNKNVVHCGFGLMFSLLGVCAMYAFLGADFLVATQVIVYVGGILVLVLFGVMMTHRIMAQSYRDEIVQPVAAAGAALLVLLLSVVMIMGQVWPVVERLQEPVPTTRALGRAFLTDWLFPFEFASVLLLVAMMGAAILTRERKSGGKDNP